MYNVIFVLSITCVFIDAVTLVDRLKEFFSSTFVRKVRGVFDPKTKKYLGIGYNTAWELYHLHHICVRGGADGIFVGIEGHEKDWGVTKENDYIAPTEWSKATRGSQPLGLLRIRHELIAKYDNVTQITEASFFANCFRQPSNTSNPAHMLMKLGFMYEMALYNELNQGNMAVMFKHPVSMPFNYLFMHQCANPTMSGWKWGSRVWETVMDRADKANVFVKNTTKIIDVGYKADRGEMYCFDDVYTSIRMGWWMHGTANQIAFRKDLALRVGEPEESLRPGFAEELIDRNAPVFRQAYCPPAIDGIRTNQASIMSTGVKSTARIKIFQRSNTRNLRKFINLRDVVDLVQTYTSIPVEVVTANESTSMAEQIRMFNSFDILITSHGSHLTNGLFTIHPHNKAVIEVVASKFDAVFYSNYNYALGFADYIFSTGHLTPEPSSDPRSGGRMCPFPTDSDFREKNCTLEQHAYPNQIVQTWTICAPRWQTRFCNLQVKLDILKNDLDVLFGLGLCSPNITAAAGADGPVGSTPSTVGFDPYAVNAPQAKIPPAIAAAPLESSKSDSTLTHH